MLSASPRINLREAVRALREGDDPLVFSRCRAAVEALLGGQRHVVDGLLHKTSSYFHLGRHTAEDGPNQGKFPVDHGDAAFALNLAKLILAHIARVLDRPAR